MLKIPLFPLELILLPYESLPLHIFEPRYKHMVKDAIENNITFGIVLHEKRSVYSKGCSVKITEVFQTYPNGEYDIMVQGVNCFDIIKTDLDGDTVIGEIEYIHLEKESDSRLFDKIQDSYLQVLIRFGIDSDMEIHMNKNISYEFIQGIQLPIMLKKELIGMGNEIERLRFINKIFNNLLTQPTNPENGNTPEA